MNKLETTTTQPSRPRGSLTKARNRVENLAFSPWGVRYVRFGMAARGVVWAVIGIVALSATFGFVKGPIGFQDSIALLESNSLRLPIGIVAAFGLLGYATWGYVR